MTNFDEMLKNLKNTDPRQLTALLKVATASLSSVQKARLKAIIDDPKALEALKGRLTGADSAALQQALSSPEQLEKLLRRGEVQKRLDELTENG